MIQAQAHTGSWSNNFHIVVAWDQLTHEQPIREQQFLNSELEKSLLF